MAIPLPQENLTELFNVLRKGTPSPGEAIQAGTAGVAQGLELGEALRAKRLQEQASVRDFQQKLAEFKQRAQEFQTTSGIQERLVGVQERQAGVAEAEQARKEVETARDVISGKDIDMFVKAMTSNDTEAIKKQFGNKSPEATRVLLSLWEKSAAAGQGGGTAGDLARRLSVLGPSLEKSDRLLSSIEQDLTGGLGIGGQLQLPILDRFKGPERRAYESNGKVFAQYATFAVSGAQAPETEVARIFNMYVIQPGDLQDPAILNNKQNGRKLLMESVKAAISGDPAAIARVQGMVTAQSLEEGLLVANMPDDAALGMSESFKSRAAVLGYNTEKAPNLQTANPFRGQTSAIDDLAALDRELGERAGRRQ